MTGSGVWQFSPFSHEPKWHIPFTVELIETPAWLSADLTTGLQRPHALDYQGAPPFQDQGKIRDRLSCVVLGQESHLPLSLKS